MGWCAAAVIKEKLLVRQGNITRYNRQGDRTQQITNQTNQQTGKENEDQYIERTQDTGIFKQGKFDQTQPFGVQLTGGDSHAQYRCEYAQQKADRCKPAKERCVAQTLDRFSELNDVRLETPRLAYAIEEAPSAPIAAITAAD